MEAESPEGLYRQPGSPYWYTSVSINGKRRRVSTKTVDPNEATRVRHELVRRYRSVRARRLAGDAWVAYVETAVADEASWLHRMLNDARRRARAHSRDFQLTIEDLKNIAIDSGGRCAVTGIPFSDDKVSGAKIAPYRQSLDRVDSSKGYTPTNSRLVCFAVNIAMRNWGDGVMHRIAKAMLLVSLKSELGDLEEI